MKLIIGLGNPGEKYANNRHNVGFMVVDALAAQKQKAKSRKQNYKALKTQVYMNESGRAVKKLTTHYSLPTTSLYVVHDDLDISLGEYKIQKGKGPKLHKGIESIETELETEDFWRVRVGVENRRVPRVVGVQRVPRGEQYVLQDFTQDERKIIDEVIGKIIRQLKSEILNPKSETNSKF